MNYEDRVHEALTIPAISIENSNECPEVKVSKSRRNNVQNLTTMLGIAAMAAPPGFLGTAAAMMGSPYKPPVQPYNERIAKLLAAEEKRQRRLERNKRNRL